MGALTLRLRGVYFAISTLSLAIVLADARGQLVLRRRYSSGAYLCRPEGLRALHDLYRISLPTMFVIAAAAAVASAAIERVDMGAGLAAIRDDETGRRRARRPDVEAQARCGDDQRRDPRHGGRAAAVLQFLCQPRLRLRDRLFGQRPRHGAGRRRGELAWPVVGALLLARFNRSRWPLSRRRRAWRSSDVFMAFVVLAPRGLIGLYRSAGREARMTAPLLKVEGLGKRFGGFVALAGIDLFCRARRTRRADRSERVRQEHLRQLPRRRLASGTRAISSSTARPQGPSGPIGERELGLARTFQLPRAFAASRSRRMSRSRCASWAPTCEPQ